MDASYNFDKNFNLLKYNRIIEKSIIVLEWNIYGKYST